MEQGHRAAAFAEPFAEPEPEHTEEQAAQKAEQTAEQRVELPELELKGSPVPVLFLSGASGTGKTYTLREKCREDPRFGLLCSTTGISAINLGVTTIHSSLGYYDTESMEENYVLGRITRRLRRLAVEEGYQNLILDEVSMLPAEQLTMLYNAMAEVNYNEAESDDKEDQCKFGLILTGDFCFGAGTPIRMADGSVIPVEELKPDDYVMGPDSIPRKVLRTTTGIDELYIVYQTNGDSYIVNSQHPIWVRRNKNGLRKEWDGIRYPECDSIFSITAPELLNKSRKFRECFSGFKAEPIELESKPYYLDPYFLGLWLGAGDSDCCRVTTADVEIEEFLHEYAARCGLKITESTWERTEAKRIALSSGQHRAGSNPVWAEMKKLELPQNKHIPALYSNNHSNVRLAVLAGLLDSDGSWTGNRYSITLTKKILAYDTKWLADSLGFRTRIRPLTNGWYAEGGAWCVTIGGDTWRIPCRVARKKSMPRNLGRSRTTSTLRVESVGPGEYYGFETDGDHLFLLADGTVAHNCQLPPVKAKWAFESEHWPHFDANTLRLTKVWRQQDQRFLDAINLIRAGNGPVGAQRLWEVRPEIFDLRTDDEWPGTTILPKNEMVDRYNMIRASKLKGAAIVEPVERWKVQRKEWDKNIPASQAFKVGGYVMLLSNSYEQVDEFEGGGKPKLVYANGDCGWLREYDSRSKVWTIELVRKDENGEPLIVQVSKLTRENVQKERPAEGEEGRGKDFYRQERGVGGSKGKWVVGTIRYWPMRYAWSATVHKCQGLSLDLVQINLNDGFIGQCGMLYVALSRARTAEGLRIVGSKELLARRCKTDARVRRWL